MRGIFCAEIVAGFPALFGEDFVAEGCGGFGPGGVVGVGGEFGSGRVLV